MSFKLAIPDFVTIFRENKRFVSEGKNEINIDDVSLVFGQFENYLKVQLTADSSPVEFIRLRWNIKFPEDAVFLGDAWERSYGDLQWQKCNASSMMPWYFFMHCSGITAAFGVKVRASSMALWSADAKGITLWLDLRSGTKGVILGGRTLIAAEVVFNEYEKISAFAAAKEFCRMMCSDPLLPPTPVYGGNNWYYAYGNSSYDSIIEDSRNIASFCEGLSNRPFMVIDHGWELLYNKPESSGPWHTANEWHGDMKKLASEMRRCGVRPGIWFRPLWNLDSSIPEEFLLPERRNGYRGLDPSVSGVLELVQKDIRRFADWGYELVKHDFSTWDVYSTFGNIPYFMAWGSWSFADRSRTAAEIFVDFYRAMHEAAPEILILGCNAIGHLAAGNMHISRSGDDTSGMAWDRTRKNGINTLAFRMCQHKTFFDLDADCVGITGDIDWRFNGAWAELLAKSGTTFFASVKPGVMNDAEKEQLKKYFAIASEQKGVAEALDWMNDPTPYKWSFDGVEQTFDWYEDEGANPDFIKHRIV